MIRINNMFCVVFEVHVWLLPEVLSMTYIYAYIPQTLSRYTQNNDMLFQVAGGM